MGQDPQQSGKPQPAPQAPQQQVVKPAPPAKPPALQPVRITRGGWNTENSEKR